MPRDAQYRDAQYRDAQCREAERSAETRSAETVVLRDPRIFSDDAALEAQYALLVEVRDRLDEIGRAVAWIHAQPGTERLAELELALVGRPAGQHDVLKDAPGLAAKIVLLPEIVVELSDTAPTAAVRAVWRELQEQLHPLLAELQELGSPEIWRTT